MSINFLKIAGYCLVIIFCFSLACQEADAGKRGLPLLFFFNTGDEFFPIGPVPPDIIEEGMENEFVGWQLGYKCSHFGLFYADVWTWDQELCVFKDMTYMELPVELRAELENLHPFSKAKRSVWNKYGILILLGVLVLYFVIRSRSSSDVAPPPPPPSP